MVQSQSPGPRSSARQAMCRVLGAGMAHHALLKLQDIRALRKVDRFEYTNDGINISLGTVLLAVTNHVFNLCVRKVSGV